MTDRATEALLASLHRATAAQLLDVVQNGVPVFNKDGEEVGREPAPAAYMTAAIKFLKDNGIEAVPTETNEIGQLAQSLPVFDEDEVAEDLPKRMN